VTFDPATEGGQLSSALDYFQYQLKGVSFLPRPRVGATQGTAYKQMPYEQITEEQYRHLVEGLRVVDYGVNSSQSKTAEIMEVADKWCDSSGCEILGAVRQPSHVDAPSHSELRRQ
jgi:ribonucleoside-triphosphate reductase